MPQPPISSQPLPEQIRHPRPSQNTQLKANSALGSVKGKKSGRKRMWQSGPNSSRASTSSVPRRSAKVMPSSTSSPSSWWKVWLCVASTVSRR